MVPWVLMYGINLLGLFSASIVIFYSLEAGDKAIGLIPLCAGIFILLGHLLVTFFLIEQGWNATTNLNTKNQLLNQEF
jgi:hypothetical protein